MDIIDYFISNFEKENLSKNEVVNIVADLCAYMSNIDPTFVIEDAADSFFIERGMNIIQAKKSFVKSGTKWNVKLYLNETEGDNIERCRLLAWCYCVESRKKYFVDWYGNFCSKEDIFISSLKWSHFCTNIDRNRQPINNGGNFIANLKNDFFELFDEQGEILLTRFISSKGEINAENIIKEMRVHYVFFDIFLNVRNVNFSTHSFSQINEVKVNHDLYRLKTVGDMQTLEEDVLNLSSPGVNAYTVDVDNILNKLKENNFIDWEGNAELDEYKENIKKNFANAYILSYGCHKLTKVILTEDNEINRTEEVLNLQQFKNIIFWVQYRCQTDYNVDKRSLLSNKQLMKRLKKELQIQLSMVKEIYGTRKCFDKYSEFLKQIKNCASPLHDKSSIKLMLDDVKNCGEIQHFSRRYESIKAGISACGDHDIKVFDDFKNDINNCLKHEQIEFRNEYSAVYHMNTKYDGIKKCWLNSRRFITSSAHCNRLLLDFLSAKNGLPKHISLSPSDEIRDNESTKKCYQFYLKKLPYFLFDPALYNQRITEYNRDFSVRNNCTYTVEEKIKGVRKIFNGRETFVKTMFRMN